MPKISEITAAIDGLTALEVGVESAEEYLTKRQAKASEVSGYETVITSAGTECTSFLHMQNLFGLVHRYGLKHRSRVWCSVANATMNRLWSGIRGWEV